MLIDLHVHTKYGSGCSILEIEDLVDQAVRVGLDAVCVTDHNTTKVVDRVKKAGKERGLLVLGGSEVRCLEGDVLIFGLDGSLPPGIPARRVMDMVHLQGGAAIPAHPFRTSAPSLRDRIFDVQGFDALESLNGNANDEENRLAEEAALKLQLPCTGGSDAHRKESVGRCITEFEDDSIEGEIDLIAALKGGRYRPRRLFKR